MFRAQLCSSSGGQILLYIWYRHTCRWPSGSLDGHLQVRCNTHSMVQSPSWEANWFAASQEILRISWNPKVHYGTHKRPPPVSIVGPPSQVHIPTSHLLEIHFNIIHPSTPRSPQWSLSLRFPHRDPIHNFSSPISATCVVIPDERPGFDFLLLMNYATLLLFEGCVVQ